MKIRIKFAKRGSMKFIGHLDVMRYFQKAMRRADVDIAYSEGFSPHQKMSFAAPLGVGLTSEGEYFDIEVHSTRSSKDMVEALNKTMAEGFFVLSYRLLPKGAQNAMSSVAAADYRIEWREDLLPDKKRKDLLEDFLDFIHQDAIPIVKETKKGKREMDLKPFIYYASCEDNLIFLRLSAGSVDNVKPELVMRAFFQKQGFLLPEHALSITRLEIYADIKEKGERKFVSLESVGDEIE